MSADTETLLAVIFVSLIVLAGVLIISGELINRETDAAAAAHLAVETRAATASLSKPCATANLASVMRSWGNAEADAKRVARFDVLGVHLYQPASVVIREVEATGLFDPSPDIGLASCASDLIAADRISRGLEAGTVAPDASTSCIGDLTFTGKDITLSVGFSEDFPEQPGCVVVNGIDLHEAGGNNGESFALWERAVTKKYGVPTYGSTWNGDEGGPEMDDLSDTMMGWLDLKDQSFTDAVSASVNQAIEADRPTVAPRL